MIGKIDFVKHNECLRHVVPSKNQLKVSSSFTNKVTTRGFQFEITIKEVSNLHSDSGSWRSYLNDLYKVFWDTTIRIEKVEIGLV